MATFDLDRHGNPRYGTAQGASDRALRTRQGKVEKSLLSFAACYPTWRPHGAAAASFVSRFKAVGEGGAAGEREVPHEVPGVAISGRWTVLPDEGAVQADGQHGAGRVSPAVRGVERGYRVASNPVWGGVEPWGARRGLRTPTCDNQLDSCDDVSAHQAQETGGTHGLRDDLGSPKSVEMQRVGSNAVHRNVSLTGASLGGFNANGGGDSRGQGLRALLQTVPSLQPVPLRNMATGPQPSCERLRAMAIEVEGMQSHSCPSSTGELAEPRVATGCTWGKGSSCTRPDEATPLRRGGPSPEGQTSSGPSHPTPRFRALSEQGSNSASAAPLSPRSTLFQAFSGHDGPSPGCSWPPLDSPPNTHPAATLPQDNTMYHAASSRHGCASFRPTNSAWASMPAGAASSLSESRWMATSAGEGQEGPIDARLSLFHGAQSRQLAMHQALQSRYEAALPAHQRARLATSHTSFYSAFSG
jgi:hypothetical protein